MDVLEQEYRSAIPVGDLTEHPDNPRRGDDASVAESIEATGFYGAIIVQKSSGRVLAGNTRYRSMVAAGAGTVPGIVVDCDDATATRIMLVDNRTSDRATYDDAVLADLLTSVRDLQGDLIGTGYDEVDLELLLSAGAEPDIGGYVPEPVEGEYHEQYGVIVICTDEAHQQGVYKMLSDDGHDCRVVVT